MITIKTFLQELMHDIPLIVSYSIGFAISLGRAWWTTVVGNLSILSISSNGIIDVTTLIANVLTIISLLAALILTWYKIKEIKRKEKEK